MIQARSMWTDGQYIFLEVTDFYNFIPSAAKWICLADANGSRAFAFAER